MNQKYLLFLLSLLILTSCSKYYKFDELYDKGDYLRAYHLLDDIKNKNNLHYQRRQYRIVLKLALDGDTDFIQKLKSLAEDGHYSEVEGYAQLAKTYQTFLEAKNPQQFGIVLSNLSDIHVVPEEFQVYAYKIRGISNYKSGKYNEAIADLSHSYKIIPFMDDIYFIGMSYYYLEDYKQAESYFNKVIGESQNDFIKSLAFFQVGEIYYYQSKYRDALEKYVDAVNIYCNSADFNNKIGMCLRKMKYPRLSRKFFMTSLRLQSNNANAWFYLNIN